MSRDALALTHLRTHSRTCGKDILLHTVAFVVTATKLELGARCSFMRTDQSQITEAKDGWRMV